MLYIMYKEECDRSIVRIEYMYKKIYSIENNKKRVHIYVKSQLEEVDR